MQDWCRSTARGREAAASAAAARPLTSSTCLLPACLQLYNRQRQFVNLGLRVPTIAPDTWVAPNAVIVGDVDLYDKVSCRSPKLHLERCSYVCFDG